MFKSMWLSVFLANGAVKGMKNTDNRKGHLSTLTLFKRYTVMQFPNHANDCPKLEGKVPTELGRGNYKAGF